MPDLRSLVISFLVLIAAVYNDNGLRITRKKDTKRDANLQRTFPQKQEESCNAITQVSIG